MKQDSATLQKLACIDGLRGLAVLLVVLFHLRAHWPIGRELGYCGDVLNHFWFGYSGVSLFFVLSGFCLTLSLRKRAQAGKPQDLSAYFRSRIRRIVPPYYASILLYLSVPFSKWCVTGQSYPDLTVRQWGSHLLFLHGFSEQTLFGICVVYWTLAVEMQFYIVLPILLLCVSRWGVNWMVVLAFASSILWHNLVPPHKFTEDGIFLGRWTEFAFGIAVAFWHERMRSSQSRLQEFSWLLVVAAVVLLYIASEAAKQNTYASNILSGAGFSLLLVSALASNVLGGGVSRLLSNPWLVWTGEISYSVYLTHVWIQGKLTRSLYQWNNAPSAWEETGFVVLTFIGIWIGGWLFYQGIERHFVRSPRPKSAAPKPVEMAQVGAPAALEVQNSGSNRVG